MIFDGNDEIISAGSLSGSSGLGKYYTVTEAWDRKGNYNYTVSSSVEITDDDTAPPALSITDAAGFAIANGGSSSESHGQSNQFKWTAADTSGVDSVVLTVKKNGVTVAGTPVTVTINSPSANPPVPASGFYSLDGLGVGTFELTATAYDNDEDWGAGDRSAITRTATLVVTNDAPTVEAGPDRVADEGQVLGFAVAASHDVDNDPLTYSWNFGDGVTASGAAVNHAFADNGSYTVTLTADDGLGGVASDIFNVVVRNKAPIIAALAISGPGQPGEPITVTVTANDVPADQLTYTFSSVAHSTVENNTGVAQLVFPNPGIYPVAVTVRDNSTGLAEKWIALQVGEPSPVLPEISFATEGVSVEEGQARWVTLTLAQPIPYPVAVPLEISGSPVFEADYRRFNNLVLFNPGATSASVLIESLDDSRDEAAMETLTLTLGPPLNGTLGAITSFALNILDNDAPPEVWFTTAGQTAEEDSGFASIAATLSAPSDLAVTVPLTLSGTASGGDYSVLSGATVTFPPGTTTQFARVQLINDVLAERNETLIVTMGTPTNATLSTAAGVYSEHTLLIPENDAPSVSFTTLLQQFTEAPGVVTATITAQLSGPYHTPVSVPFSLSGNAILGSNGDYTLSGTAFHFPVNLVAAESASITVTLVNNDIPEQLETLLVKLGTPTGGALLGPTTTSIVSIKDDDTPIVRFASASQEVYEGDVDVSIPLSIMPIIHRATKMSCV